MSKKALGLPDGCPRALGLHVCLKPEFCSMCLSAAVNGLPCIVGPPEAAFSQWYLLGFSRPPTHMVSQGLNGKDRVDKTLA